MPTSTTETTRSTASSVSPGVVIVELLGRAAETAKEKLQKLTNQK